MSLNIENALTIKDVVEQVNETLVLEEAVEFDTGFMSGNVEATGSGRFVANVWSNVNITHKIDERGTTMDKLDNRVRIVTSGFYKLSFTAHCWGGGSTGTVKASGRIGFMDADGLGGNTKPGICCGYYASRGVETVHAESCAFIKAGTVLQLAVNPNQAGFSTKANGRWYILRLY